MYRLKNNEIKDYRAAQVRKQRGICPLCKEHLDPEDATLDHCHDTGHVRMALHRSCNGAEGRILQWAGRRSRGDDPIYFLRNLIAYWKRDYTKNPVHPSHGKPKRKRKRRSRSRK
jgi:hypothetical protein